LPLGVLILAVLNLKTEKMKKLFVFLVAALAFVACNDAADGDKDPTDSSINKIDSTTDAKIDSLDNKRDSTIDKIENSEEKTDSANKAANKH
jgi:hypothetical protein